MLFADQVSELGLVLGLAAEAGRGLDGAGGLGLADAFTGVGLDGLCGRKPAWLAFRHRKDEYEINPVGAKVLRDSQRRLFAAGRTDGGANERWKSGIFSTRRLSSAHTR